MHKKKGGIDGRKIGCKQERASYYTGRKREREQVRGGPLCGSLADNGLIRPNAALKGFGSLNKQNRRWGDGLKGPTWREI